MFPIVLNSSTGESIVSFAQPVGHCIPIATLAKVPGAGNSDPAGGRITVERTDNGKVRVRTFHADGTPQIYGFHLIVVCP
ncbi:hypothetical protein C8N24_5766 [Solirubrobacter pauli]|uniref:Uncharacterized protein n=1 Tax=Solirubrobacter pauli TaxID=166793 RepID=A0A660L1B8_9ACTN|nr:hypothetical protein [Solirubrobacter pauli]RKQ87737.1 hypothetical protein C8N24_5766 [Solirubrobacter pauli]